MKQGVKLIVLEGCNWIGARVYSFESPGAGGQMIKFGAV
jgi:hypothetical protein